MMIQQQLQLLLLVLAPQTTGHSNSRRVISHCFIIFTLLLFYISPHRAIHRPFFISLGISPIQTAGTKRSLSFFFCFSVQLVNHDHF